MMWKRITQCGRWLERRGRFGGVAMLAGILSFTVGSSGLVRASDLASGVGPHASRVGYSSAEGAFGQGAPTMAGLYAGPPLTQSQRTALWKIAQRTWKFFSSDVNSQTNLPLDNIGFNGAPSQGQYTSPTDIAMYLWSIAAAVQLHLISYPSGEHLAAGALDAVNHLRKWHGFLLSWYDTNNGIPIQGPGQGPVTSLKGQFISTVDNGWYASSLVIVRNAFPSLYAKATALLQAMNFGIFYDAGNQATSITAGQMYGGYYADQGPAAFDYGNLNTDPRIAAYMGIGTGTLPSTVWWRTWRTFPASFTWQTQTPVGSTVTYLDPKTHQPYSVFEGHYSYRGITYVPSWGGSAFEALMAPLVVPEATWGTHNFGLNDLNYAEASVLYATRHLHYPVWGLSPASTPGTSGGYTAYGAYPLGSGGSANAYSQQAVTPYASFLALPFLPQQAYQNIVKLRALYPVYGPYGFYDAVNPLTGTVAPRYLVLDQGMIMAAIDDALMRGGLQRYFSRDGVGRRVKPYLETEQFSIQPIQGMDLHGYKALGH